MRGKKVKWIKDLVIGEDPALLVTMRNYYGEKTEQFDDSKLYRKAKELYSRSVPERKTWGNIFKKLDLKNIEKPIIKKEEVTNVRNNNSIVIE